jgi:HEAT repeat protein
LAADAGAVDSLKAEDGRQKQERKSTMKSKILMTLAAAAFVCSAFAADPPAHAVVDAPSVDQLLESVRSYQLGKDRRPLEQLEAIATQSVKEPARRAEIASKLAALLGSEMAFEGKDFILRTLYMMGTQAEIPAIAKLLPDEKHSHMARYVLEAMATPEATAAIRQSLANVKGRPLIGVVNSLGNLRDVESIRSLAEMTKSEDEALACAAAGALGRIGTAEAAQSLAGVDASSKAKLNAAVADAKIKCADRLLADGNAEQAVAIYESSRKSDSVPPPVRIAAARGLVKAKNEGAVPIVVEMLKSEDRQTMVMGGGLARQLRGGNATRTLAEALGSLKPEAQEVLIAALADRGDAAAKPAIAAAATSPEPLVRIAALRALASVGDAGDVPMLLDQASKGENNQREAARLALSRVRGNEVNSAILKGISADADAADRSVEAIKALAARAAAEHVSTLVELAKTSKSEPVRSAAITALGTLVEQKDYASLVDLLIGAQTDGERSAAKSALGAAAVRLDAIDQSAEVIAAAAKSAGAAAKAQLLEGLSRVGGPKALEAIRTSLKDLDPAVVDAAARALGEWRDGAVVGDLLKLMDSGKPNHRVFALRGLSRLLGNAENRRSADQMLDICKRMMATADRPEEKRLVLGRIGDIKDARALELATPHLKDPNLRNEAATAVITITQSIKKQLEDAKKAVQQVRDTPEIGESLRNQAKELMK